MRTSVMIAACLSVLFFSAYGGEDPTQVQINSLTDFTFGTLTSPFNVPPTTKFICLYRNKGRGRVRVTATGQHDSGSSFQLAPTSGSGSSRIVYQVAIAGPGSTFNSLPANVATSCPAEKTHQNCTGGSTEFSQLKITIPPSSFNDALQAGYYSDTLTLLVAPSL